MGSTTQLFIESANFLIFLLDNSPTFPVILFSSHIEVASLLAKKEFIIVFIFCLGVVFLFSYRNLKIFF